MKKLKVLLFICVMFFVTSIANVKALEMSDEFKEILTDGKFVLRSIEPTTNDEAMAIIFGYFEAKSLNFSVDIQTCNENYTKCDILYYGEGDPEQHEVDIVYSYDSDVKKIVEDYVKNIPDNEEPFAVRDLEVVNFWINGKGDVGLLSNYSSEFKEYINYKNFNIEVKRGDDGIFYTLAGGPGAFKYDDIIYKMYPLLSFEAKHIIYVPTGTGEDKLLTTAQKRIDDYIGKDKVILSGVEEEDWLDYYVTRELGYLSTTPVERRPSEATLRENGVSSLEEEMTNANATKIFKATIGEDEYYLFIVEDTDKMISPEYKTSDVGTDVTITSDSGDIPLDTLIKVNKLTTGTEYDKIIKILNVANSEMFDLNLYSNSIEKNITKLDDGSFEVRIPISEKFKDKDLIVYYVDDDGKKVEYEVKVEDGYAVFNTNHFSIYTLSEKIEVPVPTENPNTNDNIMNYVIIGSISIIGILGAMLFLNKKYN